MVAMGVGNDNMPNSPLLINLKGPGYGAGINRNDIIDQKRCHSTGRAIATKTTEDLEFHRTSITPAPQECAQLRNGSARSPKKDADQWTNRGRSRHRWKVRVRIVGSITEGSWGVKG